MFVYVLDANNRPLMPTKRFGKVRRMLKDGKAKVVRKESFIIKLLYEPKTNVVQSVTLGVDTGSNKIGTASVANDTVVYASEVQIRNNISKKMDARRSSRRNRRSRKTRYRKPRFLNRGNSTKKDRFSPTMVSKINSHIREIEFVKSILPISTLVLETGTFDPHLLKMQKEGMPFNRSWGYQKGPNYGLGNAKAACLNRDRYTCQCCKTKKGTLNAHHIIYRRNGGADTLDNLITLCEECYKRLHKGELEDFESKLKGKKKGQLKHATQMNSIRKQLLRHYPEAIETFGFITKENRQLLGLSKSHVIDACVIASQGEMLNWDLWYFKKRHVPKGDYQLAKGVRSEIRIPTHKIQGFRKFDKIKYFEKEYFIKGRMSSGFAVLMDIFSNKIDFSHMPKGFKTPKLSNLERISARSSTLCMKTKISKGVIHETIQEHIRNQG